MTLKTGVQIRNLSPQILLALFVADRLLGGNLVVTSVSDSTHSAGSLHYVGLAADLRLPADPPKFVADLKEALGGEFDVVLEGDHVHVEYQPKARAA